MLKTNLKIEDPTVIKCVMNIIPLNNSTIPFKVYNCNSCEGKPNDICELCFENCHKFHNENLKNVTETLTYMNMTKCSCALSDHRINFIGSTRTFLESDKTFKKNGDLKLFCQMNEILKFTSIKHFYREKNLEDNKIKYYCVYCINFCRSQPIVESLKHLYEAVSREEFKNQEIPQCCCRRINNHNPFYENIHCVENLLSSTQFDEILNRLEIPSILIKNFNLLEKYLLPIKQFHTIIVEKITKKIYHSLQSEPLTKTYLRSLNLLKVFGNCFPSDYFYIKNENVQEMYNFYFLSVLFKSEVIKNDKLITVKIFSLLSFRRYYIEPLLKFKSLKEFGTFENISPLLRIIFRKNINLFFIETKLEKNSFFILIDKICIQSLDYFEKISEIDYSCLIVEVLKIVLILVRYYYDKEDFHYFKNLIEKSKLIMDVVCTKKNYKNTLHKLFEDIIYFSIYNCNDRIIMNKILKPYFNDKYCFENDEAINNNFINCLFGYNKDESDNSEYIKKFEIYDLLINRNDEYIESLRCLLECSSTSFINKEIFVEFINESDLENIAQQIIHGSNFSIIKNTINNLFYHKLLYYDAKISENEFLDLTNNSLIKLKEDLILIFSIYNKNKYIYLDKQIILIKIGLLDLLMNLWKIIERSFTNKRFINENNYNSVFDIIIDILSIIFINPKITFIIPILFSNNIINILFDQHFKNKKLLDLYNNLLKKLKKKNHNLDYNFLINYLTDQYELKEIDLLENEEIMRECLPLFKMFKKCLETSNEKSIQKLNNQISTLLIRIITSKKFKILLRELFPNSEKENNFNHSDKEIYKIKIKFIQEIFSLICHLNNFSFNQMTKYIDINEFERIIYFLNDISIKTREMITRATYNFYLESPFFIYSNIKLVLDPMCRNIAKNLIADVDSEFIDEERNFNCRNKEEDLYIDFDKLFKAKDEGFENKKDEFGIDFNESIFDLNNRGSILLIFNLQKFRTILLKFKNEDENLLNNNKFLLKYFNRMIFKPTLSALYKLIYFSSSPKFKIIYLIFKIVNLFLLCYDYILELLINNIENKLLNDTGYVELDENLNKIFKKYFVINKSEMIRKINYQSILFCFRKLKDEVVETITEFDNFTELKCNIIMKSFQKISSKWKAYEEIKNLNKINTEIIKFKITKEKLKKELERNTLFFKLNKICRDYLERKKNFTKNILFNLYISNEIRAKEIKKTIALDLINRIKDNNLENNFVIIESIVRLFKADPETFQDILVATSLLSRIQIEKLAEKLKLLFQFIFINFTNLFCKDNYAYFYFIYILEFLRLLCENHNRIFQSYLIFLKLNDGSNSIYLCEFLIKMSSIIHINIQHYINKKEHLKYLTKSSKKSHVSYFDFLITSLHNFYIEIIQGAFYFNFEKVLEFSQDYVYLINKLSFELEQNPEFLFFLSNSIRFLNALMEDKNNYKKEEIAEMINYRSLLEIACFSFRKMLIEDVEEEDHYYYVKKGDSHKLLQKFLNKKNFIKNPYFILSSEIFMYLKHLSKNDVFCKEDVTNILEDLKELSIKSHKENISEKSNSMNIWKGEMYNFFDKIVREIEINFTEECEEINRSDFRKYKGFFLKKHEIANYSKIEKLLKLKESQEMTIPKNTLFNIRFLIHPMSLYIMEKDIDSFIKNAYEEENYQIKLNYLINFIEDELITQLKFREDILSKNSEIVFDFYNLDYCYHTKMSIRISILVNLLMVFSLYYSNNEKNVIVNEYSVLIFFLSMINNLYLIFLIITYTSFELYKYQNFIYKDGVGFFKKVTDFFKILCSEEIIPLVWSLIFGMIGILKPELNFLFSFQLFALFAVYPTMKIVIKSILLRYDQFMATALLIIILSVFFSSLAFYFFRDDFYNEDISENPCSSFFECFITIFNFGIRDGSIGLSIRSIFSSLRWFELALDWFFYVILILIMLNVINGIIVDTFQNLREENVKKEYLKNELCFICSLKRAKFDVRGKDFDYHRNEVHKISNYFYYIIKIKFTNKYELNSLDYHVLDCIEQRKTDFFPIKQTASLLERNN